MKYKVIGTKLQNARIKAGLSQADLARVSEVSVGTINRIEKGSYQFAQLPHVVTRLAEGLGVAPMSIADAIEDEKETVTNGE